MAHRIGKSRNAASRSLPEQASGSSLDSYDTDLIPPCCPWYFRSIMRNEALEPGHQIRSRLPLGYRRDDLRACARSRRTLQEKLESFGVPKAGAEAFGEQLRRLRVLVPDIEAATSNLDAFDGYEWLLKAGALAIKVKDHGEATRQVFIAPNTTVFSSLHFGRGSATTVKPAWIPGQPDDHRSVVRIFRLVDGGAGKRASSSEGVRSAWRLLKARHPTAQLLVLPLTLKVAMVVPDRGVMDGIQFARELKPWAGSAVDRNAAVLAAQDLLFDTRDAIVEGHRYNIRDVKPGNAVLGVDAIFRNIDFNIADKAAQRSGGMTGTITFLPPEVLEMADHDEDLLDPYAWGVSTLALLTGSHPYEDRVVFERNQKPVTVGDVISRRVAYLDVSKKARARVWSLMRAGLDDALLKIPPSLRDVVGSAVELDPTVRPNIEALAASWEASCTLPTAIAHAARKRLEELTQGSAGALVEADQAQLRRSAGRWNAWWHRPFRKPMPSLLQKPESP